MTFEVSSRLLRSRIVAGPARDPALASAFEEGTARTAPVSEPRNHIARNARRFISNGRRVHPTSPDKLKSRQRKRMWGGSSCLPDWMRQHYTEGERAVLAVIVQEVKRHGYCDLAINAIAAAAGVHRTTVQNAIREARRLCHLTVQERPGVAGQLSMTNIVRIVCGRWKGWLRRVGSGFKTLRPSQLREEEQQANGTEATVAMALERESAVAVVPLSHALPLRLTEPRLDGDRSDHHARRWNWRN